MIIPNTAFRGSHPVCVRNQRKIAVLSGLKVKYLKQAELIKRMEALNKASLAGESALQTLKLGSSRASKVAIREHPDRLFDPEFLKRALLFLLSADVTGEDDWDPDAALTSWEDKGSVNIPIFKWWWEMDGGVARIIEDELDMYKHHTPQQLASQEPVHYAIYAALRPDHWTSLLSYPYYAKYSEIDDKHQTTGGFEHIDQNVEKLLSGESGLKSQVQGSISFDDESSQNCTKIAPGFHKPGVLEKWWKELLEHHRKNGPVTRILPSAQLKWEAAPCRKGEARFTMPQIPPALNLGAGTDQDGALARISCMPPKATQSGKPIYNSYIPYKFPACVRLESLGALSDALIGLRQSAAPELILTWRAKAYTTAHAPFDVIKKTEQGIFQSKSYWNKQAADYPFDSDESIGDMVTDSGEEAQCGTLGNEGTPLRN
ncbi:df26889f-7eb2-456f-a59f-8e900f60c752 [Sclerotinia trifoliorum]|uniref:Df26889f-7eb2-456f-a59f-8e900f60c752 n=1 Tax=Sclerotinia trifoliorum TaxID=28548 RepID=A0A8H2ZTQ1_9HELO|nr:df26889f-7eb2-456f-a59f-8e900f60c752 [Sclerotinia trifoliorum]